MHWARVDADGHQRLAVLDGDGVRCLGATGENQALSRAAQDALGRGDLVSWIVADAEAEGMLGLQVAERLGRLPVRPASSVRLLAPIPRPPKNIVCVGRNYFEHAIEAARFRGQKEEPPAHPVFFTKPATAIVGPDDDICWDPLVTSELDYEGEVAVVIGKPGKNISPDAAYDHVFGFSLLNDVTARDLQARHGQYYKGKGLDTFAPLGPYIVTRDEVPDPREVLLETRINGELRQRALLSDLIFPIADLISVLSAGMTLECGDVLSTGTPPGVGMSFTPPRFLKDGDVIEISSPSLGVLRSRVKATNPVHRDRHRPTERQRMARSRVNTDADKAVLEPFKAPGVPSGRTRNP